MDQHRQALDIFLNFLNKAISTTYKDKNYDSLHCQIDYLVFIMKYVDNFSFLLESHTDFMVSKKQHLTFYNVNLIVLPF